MTHVQHPREVTPELARAVERIRSRCMSVYNQQVYTVENSRRFETAKLLMSKLKDKKGKVRLLGVGVSGLEPVKDVQLTLFGDEKRLKSRATEDAVDQVRKRFGKGAIIRGSLLEDE